MTVAGFTAAAACPRCDTVAVHWLRLPPSAREVASARVRYHRDLVAWSEGGYEPRVLPLAEVVRECMRCGWEWGQ